MPFTRPRLTRPLPRPATGRRPLRLGNPRDGATLPLSYLLGTWNFAVQVYVAWDPPTAANPAWIDVTTFVETETSTITIIRGRPDGMSDPSVGTCALSVDNSDGRWSPANPNGPWFGQIRKGAWLRVDLLPPSGAVSTRFVGFIQQLPVTWSGRYSTAQISASDRFVLLGNARKYRGAIAEEWLADPNAGAAIVGYWSLHEPQGSPYVSDISGQAPVGQSALKVYSQGANPGGGLSFANTPAPGYDGASTATFAPFGALLQNAGNTGSYNQGSYLQGNVGPLGNQFAISCWVNSTVSYQPIWSLTDPANNYGLALMFYISEFLCLVQYPLNGVYTTIGNCASQLTGNQNLADGQWHHVTVVIKTAAAVNNLPFGAGQGGYLNITIDGRTTLSYYTANTPTTQIVPPATLSRLTLGGAESWQLFNTDPLPGGVAMFTGSLSDVVVHQLPNNATMPDWYGVEQAGTTMWQQPNTSYALPESCGRRVIRLASYTGLATPQTTFVLPGLNIGLDPAATGSDVAPGLSPFINIPAETAHPAGFQQIIGADPLTAMRTAAHTENMPLFIDRQGRFTLQPSTLRQNPAAAFTIDANDLDPATGWADDFQYFTNQTVVTPSGLGSLTVNTNGAVSQNLNGLYSASLDTVTISPIESGALGAAVNAAGSNPAPRTSPLQCEVATLATQAGYGAAWYDAVLASDVSSVAQVVNWPAGTPGGSSGTYYLEGYTETIGAGQHTFAWNTTATQAPTYQCDSPTLGVIDTPGLVLAY